MNISMTANAIPPIDTIVRAGWCVRFFHASGVRFIDRDRLILWTDNGDIDL